MRDSPTRMARTPASATRFTSSHVERRRERRKIAVIDANDPGLREPLEDEVQLTLVMHLDQHIQAELLPGQMVIVDQLLTVEYRHDQEHGVGQMRPRFVELKFVHHELLVERG